MNKYILLFIFTLISIVSFGQNRQENKDESNETLKGRPTKYIPTIDNDCNQSGRVILEIIVNRAGEVISAVDVKGTTADACLIALAKKYALQTRWKPSETAAEKQVGTITYNFTF